MDNLETLQAMGLTLPSPAYIVGSVAFGIVGILAFRHGKRAGKPCSKWLGVALMVYPYAVSQTWLLYVVGAVLCAGIFIDRG